MLRSKPLIVNAGTYLCEELDLILWLVITQCMEKKYAYYVSICTTIHFH